ncbi:hypothetical protein ACG2F4_08350 [Halalkalibaculum sp. DA3122]|uniref:hypothetical protein n=1 Tax=unclassified Halalkalibaculum TaxID=2964617 RepID=UPI00375505D3
MMDWDAFLLLVVGLYAAVKTSQLAYRTQNFKHLSYASAILFFSMGQGGILLNTILSGYDMTIEMPLFIEFTSVIAVSLALCGLAVFIRESKPVFAQFPLIYAAVPLLLILSYWFVRDSFAIKAWLLSIYEGGALLVALMMYGTRSYRSAEIVHFKYMLAATLLFLVTYILYWFVPGMSSDYSWVWQLVLGAGVMTTALASRFNIKHIATPEMEY